MGNTCTCFNDDNKDREEFESLATNRKNKEQHAITIQKNFKGYKARKQYSQLKEQINSGGNFGYSSNTPFVGGVVD